MAASPRDTRTEPRPAAPKPLRLARQPARLPGIVTVGQKRTPLEDLYHWILTRTWLQFFGLVAATFVILNSIFACAYLMVPGAITNLEPGSFEGAFFFSVQTLATIGYGVMAPATRAGHILVSFEALVGMLCVSLMTGITFAKFARPTARVMFADKIVITPRNGVPHLMFRMANWRGNQMIDATLKVMVLITETTAEGETMRVPHELKLVRDKTMMFILTWMPMHRIDETSPFHGPGAVDRLRKAKAEIYLSLIGHDETIGQTVHSRHMYTPDDIVENARFADMLSVREDGTRELNYHNIHEVIPLDAPATSAPASAEAPAPSSEGAPAETLAKPAPSVEPESGARPFPVAAARPVVSDAAEASR